jgi:hypothetical protein
MEKIGRFKPGANVSVFAEAAIKAARFVAIQGKKTARGDYPAKHAGAGNVHPFGVSQYDSAPATQPAHSRERLVEVMRGGIPFVEAGEEIPVLSEVAVGAEGKAVVADPGVAAFLDKGVQGENNAVTYTAREAGEDGNDLEVELLNTGKEKALSVDVDGNVISVTLATNNVGAGEVTSTALQVIAAIAEHDAASQLIVAANKGASTGAGVIKAFAKTALSGGEDATDAAAAVGQALTEAEEAGDFIEVAIF